MRTVVPFAGSIVLLLAAVIAAAEAPAEGHEDPAPSGKRGHAEKQERSAPHKVFTCKDGSGLKIPTAWVGDDYCDCADGSDELETSACSHISGVMYRCMNVGHEPKSLPTSRVGDGVCDCCDGSDEGRRVCPDTCKVVGLDSRRKRAMSQRILRQGLRARKKTLQAHSKLLASSREEISALEADLILGESLAAAVEARMYAEEAIEHRERVWRAEKISELVSTRNSNGGDPNENGSGSSKVKRETRVELKAINGHGDASSGTKNVPKISERLNRSNLFLPASTLFEGVETPEQAVSSPERNCTLQEFLASKPTDKVSTLEVLAAKTRTRGTFGISLKDISAGIGGMPPDTQETLKKQQWSVAQKRKHGFLGPIFNGGRAGWARGTRHILSAVGIVVSPVRFVAEVMGFVTHYLLLGLGLITPSAIGDPLEAWYARIKKRIWRNFGVHARRVWRRYNGPWVTKAVWNAVPELYRYFFPALDESHVRAEAEAMRKTKRLISTELTSIKSRIEKLKKILEQNYGPGGVFATLAQQCVSASFQGYKYSLCAFDKVTQNGATQLGKWQGFGDFGQDEKKAAEGSVPTENDTDLSKYMTWWFTGGDKCHNGPKRRTKVRLECSPDTLLESVVEPERCLYEFNLLTPGACNPKDLDSEFDQVEEACWNMKTASCTPDI